jgi:hypothetical protein
MPTKSSLSWKTMELGDFLLCLTESTRVGKRLRDSLAGQPSGQPDLRIMTRIVRLGAMAGWLAATPDHGGNGTRPEIAQAQEFIQELGPIRF